MFDPNHQEEGAGWPAPAPAFPEPVIPGPSSVPFPGGMPQPQIPPLGDAPGPYPLHGVPVSAPGQAYALNRSNSRPAYLVSQAPSAHSHASRHSRSRHGHHHDGHHHHAQQEYLAPATAVPVLSSSHGHDHRDRDHSHRHTRVLSSSRHARHRGAPAIPQIVVSRAFPSCLPFLSRKQRLNAPAPTAPSERGHTPPPARGTQQIRVRYAEPPAGHAHPERGARRARAPSPHPRRLRRERSRDRDRDRERSAAHEREKERAREGNVRGLVWGRGLEAFQHPQFMFSRCTGKKKALCIGINYTGQKSALHGCINDARSVQRFLIDYYRYDPRRVVLLTDDARDARDLPTKANILGAMRWLVRGARAHDALFLHYSGHGGQTRDKDGDEVDGYDEMIFPLDYNRAGTIVDDVIHDTVIRPLPPGCRLTAVFDSCHSGSVLDLPYMYHSNGRISGSNVTRRFMKQKATPAEVICWSGCKDSQTTVDTHEGGLAVGAMSYAFLKVLKRNPKISYRDLLRGLKDVTKQYHQKAQLSASHRIDTNRRFVM